MSPSHTRGIVFDIQRFALHDGPGIRTTVFLKGCPLHCTWCHNPESQAFQPQLSFNREKCNGCFACVSACPTGAHRIVDGRLEIDFERATDCNPCVAACPTGALKVIGYDASVEELMRVVLRDTAYYRRSGGGLTLSGGEPLAQFEFASALLREAKRHSLHTCLDTCGQARQAYFEAVLDSVDLFLYDYKATDADEHERLTGVPNSLILRNLDFLYRNGARILLRCPLIPGLNDSPAHLAAIARLEERYPDLAGIEIMPFHNMGREKAVRIGRPALLPDLPTATDAQKARWLQTLSSYGSTRAVLG